MPSCTIRPLQLSLAPLTRQAGGLAEKEWKLRTYHLTNFILTRASAGYAHPHVHFPSAQCLLCHVFQLFPIVFLVFCSLVWPFRPTLPQPKASIFSSCRFIHSGTQFYYSLSITEITKENCEFFILACLENLFICHAEPSCTSLSPPPPIASTAL
jgi:hypothetical protein